MKQIHSFASQTTGDHRYSFIAILASYLSEEYTNVNDVHLSKMWKGVSYKSKRIWHELYTDENHKAAKQQSFIMNG